MSVNSVELGYEDHGIGLPILFLHAFPLNRTMWEDQVTALLKEQRFRLVSLDWRGFGESSLTSGITSMDMLADDVVALMDILGMPQAILCGLSMGGYVAFALYRKYPQRVGGLILADTRPGADTEEGKANREQLARLVEQRGTDAVADLQVPRLLAASTRQYHPDVELKVRRMITTATSQGIASLARGMALRADSTDLLSHITCPTLVIAGQEDELTPPATARDYAAQIPGAQFASIAHAGHLSNLEQSEDFQSILHNFLTTTW